MTQLFTVGLAVATVALSACSDEPSLPACEEPVNRDDVCTSATTGWIVECDVDV